MRTWLISIREQTSPLSDGDPATEEAVSAFLDRLQQLGHEAVATCTPKPGVRGGTEGCWIGDPAPAVVASVNPGTSEEPVSVTPDP